jgi:glycosyltransferase involved in cell wall biosynthesis
MRVAAFTKYDREAASTRQRLLQYVPSLELAGFTVEHHPLLGDDYVRGLVSGRRPSPLSVVRAYGRRLEQLVAARDCDLIWVYAELFPWLPAAFERLALRAGKPIIYDMDDAFFIPYEGKPLLDGKLEPLLRAAAACTCGNDYLRDYASRFCERSMVVPTVVDTALYRPARKAASRSLTIGWIGSPSTWGSVRPLLPLLGQLCAERGVRFRVVGAGAEGKRDRFSGLELVDWSEASEIAEIQRMDIGIMPMLDDPFQRGKSGYKLVQYMACGLPVVASPVGVNSRIVSNGENGFLASSTGEWRAALNRLLDDPSLRKAMGKASRTLAERSYSLASQAPRVTGLFEWVASGAPAS